MYFPLMSASIIILTVIIGFQIFNGSNGISLIVTTPITAHAQEDRTKSFEITHGVASGDVTNDSAIDIP